MRLVLQCAMCGTHHPVGTDICSTCRATGVTQLRLMFECVTCGRLGLNPTCETCPPVAALSLDDDELIVAEEIPNEPLTLDDDAEYSDIDLVIDFDDEEEGEKSVFDLSDDLDDKDEDEDEDPLTEFMDDDFDDPDEDEEERDFDDSELDVLDDRD